MYIKTDNFAIIEYGHATQDIYVMFSSYFDPDIFVIDSKSMNVFAHLQHTNISWDRPWNFNTT